MPWVRFEHCPRCGRIVVWLRSPSGLPTGVDIDVSDVGFLDIDLERGRFTQLSPSAAEKARAGERRLHLPHEVSCRRPNAEDS